MSKPETTENFKHATKEDAGHHVKEQASNRLRDEAHSHLKTEQAPKHGEKCAPQDGKAAGKSEPAHLEFSNIFSEQNVNKVAGDAGNAIKHGLTAAATAVGDEANKTWKDMDKSAAGHFYKHEICGDDIVKGVIAAPSAVAMVAGGAVVTGLVAAEAAVPVAAVGAFMGTMGVLGTAIDYMNRHH